MFNFYKTFLFIGCIAVAQASTDPFLNQPRSGIPLIPFRMPHIPSVEIENGLYTPRSQTIGSQKQSLTPRPPKLSSNEARMYAHRLYGVLQEAICPDTTTEQNVVDHFNHEVNCRLGGMLGLDDEEERITQKLAYFLIKQSIEVRAQERCDKLREELEIKMEALFPRLEERNSEAEKLADSYNVYLQQLDDAIKEKKESIEGYDRSIRGIQHTLNAVRKKSDSLTDSDKERLFQDSRSLKGELHTKSRFALGKMEILREKHQRLIAQRTVMIRREFCMRDQLEDQAIKEISDLKILLQRGIHAIHVGKKPPSAEDVAQERERMALAALKKKALLKRL